MDDEFFEGATTAKQSGCLSEGRKSPPIARLYNNTRIMTVVKWINWNCIDKTGMERMQISCGTVWSYSSTVAGIFWYRNPHVKQ